MQRLDKGSDNNVFFNDKYIHGIRARVNAGCGLWPFALGPRLPRDMTGYAAARIMGVTPNVLVVSPEHGRGTRDPDGRSHQRHVERLARFRRTERLALFSGVTTMADKQVNTIPLPQIGGDKAESLVRSGPRARSI